MDVIIHFLIEHGLWGMFIAAFFAGSILPLASEVVLSALVAAGVAPLELLIVGTIGNTPSVLPPTTASDVSDVKT